MFEALMAVMQQDVVEKVFSVQVQRQQDVEQIQQRQAAARRDEPRRRDRDAGGGAGQARSRKSRPQRSMPVRLRQEIQTLPRQVTRGRASSNRIPLMKVELEPAAVRGFRFAGVSAGLKTKAGALDLGLIAADRPGRCRSSVQRQSRQGRASLCDGGSRQVGTLAGGRRELRMRQQLHRRSGDAARARFMRAKSRDCSDARRNSSRRLRPA